MYIYLIENKINGKIYIGQSKYIDCRRRAHFSEGSKCPAIAAAIRKYGSENFEFSLLERCLSEENLNAREKFWIEELKTLAPQGYNLKSGGSQGGSPSKEVKERISASLTGKVQSLETRDRRSRSLKVRYDKFGHPNQGKKRSEDFCQKQSRSHSGDKHWAYGKKMRPESVERMRISKTGKKLASRSEESKFRSMRALQSRSSLSPDLVLEIREKYAFGKISQRSLAAEYGISQAQIGNILRNKSWRNV